jgi:DNA repair exonuclease SbcCD ATPase subunit
VTRLTDELAAVKEENKKLGVQTITEGVVSEAVFQVLNEDRRKMEEKEEKLEGELESVRRERDEAKQFYEMEKTRAEAEHKKALEEKQRWIKSIDDHKSKLEAQNLKSELDQEKAKVTYGHTIEELKAENARLEKRLQEKENAHVKSREAANGSLRKLFAVLAFATVVFSLWRPLRIQ